VAERLLKNDAPTDRTTQSREVTHNRTEQRRRDLAIEGRVFRRAELGAEYVKSRRIGVFSVDIPQQPAQCFKRRRVESSAAFDALSGASS